MAKSHTTVEVLEVPMPRSGPWEMPVPRSGVVTWRQSDNSGEKCTALITAVHRNSIDVMVIPSGVHMPQPRTGCKHVSDPSLRKMAQANPGGAWEFTEMEQIVRRLAGLEPE